MVRWEEGSLGQLIAMRVDQHHVEAGHQPCGIERQALEEVGEARLSRHLAMIDCPQALGLLPGGGQRAVAVFERDLRHVGGQRRVQMAGGGAHGLAADLDERQAVALEADQRVEQVEEYGGVRHSGLRLL